MALNDLLSSSFLFSIAIIIILIGGIFAYVSYRMSEQDHKITSMLGLVSTMAEELQFFRSRGSGQNSELDEQQQTQTQSHSHSHIILNPNNLVAGQPTLISVSDDEDDEDLEEDLEEDDEDEDEDDEDDLEDDDEDDLEDDDDVNDLEDECDTNQIQNIKSIHLEEPIDLNLEEDVPQSLNYDLNVDQSLDHSDELLVQDLQTISISDLEETNKKPDYKKMSLSKLKEVVVEKGVVADASKLKKNDILKLLGLE
jgi:hypothetical protein